jgi:hypothetical protein
MKQLPILFLAALLLAAPAGQLSAHALPASLVADESLSDATVQQVLDLAAPLVGESSASLYRRYEAGTVTITDLGPILGGHRYAVHYQAGAEFVIVDEMNL